MRPLQLVFLLGTLGFLGGCGFSPAGEQPMIAPDVYRTWWDKTEACSGLGGDFDRVEWIVVPGHGFSCSSGQCAGHWESDHRIFIASDWAQNEMVVRHEMLHDLLNRPGHPNPPFGQGCPLTWDTWKGYDSTTSSASLMRAGLVVE